jgi:LysM repeat protein
MKKLLSVALAGGLLLSAGGNAFAATGDEVIGTGTKYLGTPYQYGAPLGNTSSFDCSSFTAFVFGQNGVQLPRTSSAQSGAGYAVSKSNLQKGDLVFFNTSGSGISHVGIYAGNGQMINAQTGGVKYANINSSYWGPRYVTARRVVDNAPSQAVVTQTAEKEVVKAAATTAPTGVSTHTVVSGDTLWAISQKYSTTVSGLKSLNGLSSDMIYVGQSLKVSGSAPTTSGNYTVKSGDTLWAIAQANGTSVSALKSANKLTSDMIHPGQSLVIPN